ncbi:hypothetical protein GQ457_07G024770 [Hibiscus cannabinus]
MGEGHMLGIRPIIVIIKTTTIIQSLLTPLGTPSILPKPSHLFLIAKIMAATTTTSNCSGFFDLGSNEVEVEAKAVKPSSSAAGDTPPSACGKLDGVAIWFVNGVATAFFASLERCSCIRIATEEANDAPLIHSDGNMMHDAGTSSRRRTRKGKKKQGALLDD